MFLGLMLIVGIAAGAVAAVSGFGIGSLLTPAFAIYTGTKLAIAAAAIPHLLGSALRVWILRKDIDYKILWGFGIASAVFGLTGALLHNFIGGRMLTFMFGVILVFAGGMGITGLAEKMQFKGAAAWAAGAFSGFLGGMVGNQGGIRSAAMLGLNVPKRAFVATASAVSIMVDGVRIPVYIANQSEKLLGIWPYIAGAGAAVIIGTLAGQKLLTFIPERFFKRVVAAIVLFLGVIMILENWAE